MPKWQIKLTKVTLEVTLGNFGRLNGSQKSQKTNKIISQDGNRTRTPLVGTQDFKSSEGSDTYPEYVWNAVIYQFRLTVVTPNQEGSFALMVTLQVT